MAMEDLKLEGSSLGPYLFKGRSVMARLFQKDGADEMTMEGKTPTPATGTPLKSQIYLPQVVINLALCGNSVTGAECSRVVPA